METITFSKIVREDLDIGTGTRQLRLQDNSLVTVNQVSLAGLLVLQTWGVTPTAGAATVVIPGGLLARARIAGVTTEILVSLGTTQGLTGFAVGDGTLMDRWGQQTVLTIGAQTDQGNFRLSEWPLYVAATDIVLSALGGAFDGTGGIEITTHYFLLPHRRA